MSIPICIDCADGGIINCGSINDVKYIYDPNAMIYIMKQDCQSDILMLFYGKHYKII